MIDFQAFSNCKILVIGDLMLDRYCWGSVDRISPEAPVPIVRLERTSVAAGGAANVAANIAGLGAKAVLVGITGNDQEAEVFSDIISKISGILDSTISSSERDTIVKTRIVANNQHVVRLDQELIKPISLEHEEAIFQKMSEHLPNVKGVVISDYAKGLLTNRLLMKIITAASDANKAVFVDPKGKDFNKYANSTLITPNLSEAAQACGMSTDDLNLVEVSGKRLVESLSLSGVLITEGEKGMTLFEPSCESVHFDAIARNVFDVTGAGDTVVATMAVAASSGFTFAEAARLANYAAGIAVGKVGTTVVTQADLVDFLSNEHPNTANIRSH